MFFPFYTIVNWISSEFWTISSTIQDIWRRHLEQWRTSNNCLTFKLQHFLILIKKCCKKKKRPMKPSLWASSGSQLESWVFHGIHHGNTLKPSVATLLFLLFTKYFRSSTSTTASTCRFRVYLPGVRVSSPCRTELGVWGATGCLCRLFFWLVDSSLSNVRTM